jgi:hypothetical protein
MSKSITKLDNIFSSPILGIEAFPVREESGATIVQQGTQIHTGVPICCEIGDATFWKYSLWRSSYT